MNTSIEGYRRPNGQFGNQPRDEAVVNDLQEAAQDDTCQGCGRNSFKCSIAPCIDVSLDRGEGIENLADEFDPEDQRNESDLDSYLRDRYAAARAAYALKAIDCGEYTDEEQIRNMLADLMHLADRLGMENLDEVYARERSFHG